MTTDASSAVLTPTSGQPGPVDQSTRREILVYVGILMALTGYCTPQGGLIYIPVSFILKNKLHLSAHEVAEFRLWTALPFYYAFLFGFTRDAFINKGIGDRGLLLVFGICGTLIYSSFAFLPFGYWTLVLSFVLLAVSYLMIASAVRGLASVFGQRQLISGQVSTVWTLVTLLPSFTAVLGGGALSQLLEGENTDRAVRVVFLIGAGIMAAIAVVGASWPRMKCEEPQTPTLRGGLKLAGLIRLRPIYPVLLISLLWYFMPGTGTPLQFYFQNSLYGNDAQWGVWNAIADVSNIPALFIFGYLCRRVALRELLFWGTIIGIPQTLPLLFMHSVTGGLVAAVPFGFTSAIATAAYLDLVIRICPRGMQGTVLMAFYCLENFASRFGDVLGTRMFDYWGGFRVCVAATMVTTALIIPLLFLIPKELVAVPDQSGLEKQYS